MTKECVHYFKITGEFTKENEHFNLEKCYFCEEYKINKIDNLNKNKYHFLINVVNLEQLKEIHGNLLESLKFLNIKFGNMKGEIPYSIKTSYYNLKNVVEDIGLIIKEFEK